MCLHCEKGISPPGGHRLCRKCAPYAYNKNEHPHQKERRGLIWLEARSRRIAQSNNKCERCGGEVKLQVHHKMEVSVETYMYMWKRSVRNAIHDISLLNNSLGKRWQEEYRKATLIRACPHCESARIGTGPNKICHKCNREFDEPIYREPQNKRNISPEEVHERALKRVEKVIWDDVVLTYYDNIKIEYEALVKVLLKYYVSMEDTIVLCGGCHLKASRTTYKSFIGGFWIEYDDAKKEIERQYHREYGGRRCIDYSGI